MFVLLVNDDPGGAQPIRQALADPEGSFTVQCVERVRTALARIGGGGVDAIVMPLSATSAPLQERFAGLVHLHSSAPQVPIIAILDSDDEKAAIQSLDLGAAAYCLKEKCDRDLSGVIRSAVKKERQPAGSIAVEKPRFLQTAEIISVFGAKGGVGTSTVALNLASALAQKGKVILAELTPAFGTLGQYFGLHDHAPGIASFKEMPSDLIGIDEVKSCLWSVSKQPELSIFLGPQTVEDCKEIRPDRACAISRALAGLADHVVIDLPVALSEANRAILQISDIAAIVVDRDPMSIESAKRMLQAIKLWNITPGEMRVVVVNRAALSSPTQLSQIESQLGIPLLGVVPPAPDLCIAAQRARTPLITFYPDSSAARSFITLAEHLTTQGGLRRVSASSLKWNQLAERRN